MASTKMKIKKNKAGGHDVMVLAKHPMETGLRKDKKTGEKVPAHFIQTMDFALNGAIVAQANLGPGVSKNPLISISVTGGNAGDTVSVNWTDNKGESGNAEKTIK
jgi:sulfur-oxidizing protein SoxZ